VGSSLRGEKEGVKRSGRRRVMVGLRRNPKRPKGRCGDPAAVNGGSVVESLVLISAVVKRGAKELEGGVYKGQKKEVERASTKIAVDRTRPVPVR